MTMLAQPLERGIEVAGSSGTPDGFNAAIQRIKAEATN